MSRNFDICIAGTLNQTMALPSAGTRQKVTIDFPKPGESRLERISVPNYRFHARDGLCTSRQLCAKLFDRPG
jgi:hypothetical protein